MFAVAADYYVHRSFVDYKKKKHELENWNSSYFDCPVESQGYYKGQGCLHSYQSTSSIGWSIQIEYEVRDDSPGLWYTVPDGSKKWTPVVVNRDGHESEFNVVDPEGIPKNVSFRLFHETPYLCTSYGPSSKVLTPIAKRTRCRVNTYTVAN